jgi:uncharacterized protein with ATP-grasp and redox domains
MTKRASYYTIPDGCSKHPSCSVCPEPECKASLKDLKKQSAIDNVHQKVLELHSKNVSAKAISQRVGFKDIRTVYKIINEGH